MYMKKLILCITLGTAILCGVTEGNAENTRATTTSSCSLINPPNSSVDWKFYGNQGVWVYLQNGNALGVTARLGYYFAGEWDFTSYAILPFAKTSEKYYSVFGQTPIHWVFELSTVSDAAAIYGYARWNPF